MAKEAFGGKVVDLKASGLAEMTLGEMLQDVMGKKKRIAPTQVVGAFWKALREAEIKDKVRYFGTPEELGEELSKTEIKELKTKLNR